MTTLEGQSIDTVSGIEHSILLYAVDIEIWFHIIL